MKLRSHQFSTPQRISKHRADIYEHYEHPWYKFNSSEQLKKPNPPSQAAVKKAKFVDKTYKWNPKTP